MHRFITLSMLFLAGIYGLACNGNTAGPDDLSLGIHGTIKNQNGNLVDDVGVHLIFPLGTNVGSFKSRPNSKVFFASQALPMQYALEQNYPNPFNPSTGIIYQLPTNSNVQLSIHDMSGNLIKQLVDQSQTAGAYSVVWNGTNDAGDNITNGVYTYRLQAGDFDAQKEMLLDMLGPEHIRQINSIPLVSSDDNGEFRLPFSQIPFGKTINITHETGPDILGQFTISDVSIVLLKKGYRSLVKSLDSDITKTATLDFTLIAE